MAHTSEPTPRASATGLPSIPMLSPEQNALGSYDSPIEPSTSDAPVTSPPVASTPPVPPQEAQASAANPAPSMPNAASGGLFVDMLKLSEFRNAAKVPDSTEPPKPAAPDLDNKEVRAILSKSGVNWKANPADIVAKPPSVSPVVSLVIKNKATQLMTQAYANKDNVIPIAEATSSDVTIKEQMEAALSYMVKMHWVKELQPTVYVLTKDGQLVVEQTLSF